MPRRLPVPLRCVLRRGVLRRPAGRRPAAVALHAVVLLALLGGTTGWALSSKQVVVTVDGQPHRVRTHGTAIRDALREAGFAAGPYDLVVPAPEQRLDDGDHIALRRARRLDLLLDGQRRSVWVTAATVEEALRQVGVRVAGARLSASRSRDIPLDGLAVRVQTAKAVSVVADGRARVLRSTGATVGDALREAGVAVGGADLVSPPAGAPLTDLLTVRVTRVSAGRVVESLPVPYPTTRRPDPGLLQGRTRVLVAGRPGVLVRTYDVRFVDRRPQGRTLRSERLVAAPVTEVLAVGTRPRPAARRSSETGTSADGLDWAALARCESGGNPRAVSSTGRYRGLYQFSIATWRSVGGEGDPIDAAPAEQTYRAKLLYQRSGRGQWPVCGKYL